MWSRAALSSGVLMAVRAPRSTFLLLTAALALVAPGLLVPARAATAPVVTGVASSSGSVAGGSLVTLHGTGFTGAYRVAFGGAYTSSLHVWSSTEMTVRVPAHGAGRTYVRVARPGTASGLSARATYTYVATPRPLVLTGAEAPAPAVGVFTAHPDVDLSCSSATLCAAVGTKGLSTYDGTSWSALLPTPTPAQGHTANPEVSCGGTLCLALTYDAHLWRWQGGWTDLGERPRLHGLSCGGPTLCAAVLDDQAVLYDGTAWGPPATLFDGGVTAVACGSATSCLASSLSSHYRTWFGAWSASRPMWTTASLREGTLTDRVVGTLDCASPTYCVSLGGTTRQGELSVYAVFTGSTWSLRQTISTTPRRQGSYPDLECTAPSFCLTTTGLVGLGGGSYPWVVTDGTAAGPTSLSGTPAISCWAPYQCLALTTAGTYRKAVAG